MNLQNYLKRIQFYTPPAADLDTLNRLISQHINNIPFENLDVQLGIPIDTEITSSYSKIIEAARGGWCYEMNGLFEWVLKELGFEVHRLSAGVNRIEAGDSTLGNHLCLKVNLDQAYLVDVGFGGSLSRATPIAEHQSSHPPYKIELTKTEDSFWRFTETIHGKPFSFDFRESTADEKLLNKKCTELQTAQTSPFVQNFVTQMRSGEKHYSLRGKVFTVRTKEDTTTHTLNSLDEFMTTLCDIFNLDVPEAASIWPKICLRHEELFSTDQTSG